MYRYPLLLNALCAEVADDLAHQVTDPDHPAFGAFISPSYGMPAADHTSGALSVARVVVALLADESPLRDNTDLSRRALAGIEFIRRWQRPTGLIDLPKIDFDSPPDSAFVVQLLCPALELAERRASLGSDTAATIAAALISVLTPMATGIVGRGFRTPNHRWVICSALAQAGPLIEGVEAETYLTQILAETIDINPDGEFSERSTGIYNAVCNRALRYLARHLDRHDLLDHVRANLHFMANLMSEDGSVMTTISRRQDQGLSAYPVSMADSFFDMGIRDGNSEWIDISDQLARHELAHRQYPLASDHSVYWMLQPFLERPSGVDWPRRAVNGRVRKSSTFLPHSKLWSCNDGLSRALVLGGNATAFSLRHGDVSLHSLRVFGTYFQTTHFVADVIEPLVDDSETNAVPTGVVLRHLASKRRRAGWDLPLGRPVQFDDPHHGYYPLADGGDRRRWLLSPMDIQLVVVKAQGGFDLTLTTIGGCDRVPFAVEMFFPAGGALETPDMSTVAVEGADVVLRRGNLVYRNGRHAIQVGPGCDAHRLLTQTHNAGRPKGYCRVVVPLVSPVSHTLQIRTGLWSESTRSLASVEALEQAPADAQMKSVYTRLTLTEPLAAP